MLKQRDKSEIVISSYEMITPLGENSLQSFENLIQGQSGIGTISRFDSSDIDVHYAGEVPEIDFLSYDIFNARELKNWFSPVISHSLLVADEAVKKSQLKISNENAHRIAVCFSSAIGGLDAIIYADQQFIEKKATPHPFTNVNVCLNLIAGKISMLHKTKGPIFSPVAACATGNVSLATGAMLIQQGMADAVICGAVDFPLVKSIVLSFSSMNGAFNSSKEDDRAYNNPAKASRPFSIDRKGFIISEGAAALVICSREYAEKNNLNIECTLKGFSMNSDGYHYVHPNVETTGQCMEDAISNAGIDKSEIGLINAHAASTKVGDANEVKALSGVFGDEFNIPVCANKSQIGHTMGASSAIESIFSILSLKNNIIPPCINYLKDDKLNLNLSENKREQNINYVLNNSFGFGGTNCCTIFGKTF